MTPIVHFSRRYHFSASHRLHVAGYTDAQNRETFGKCNNPYGHGHNYTLQVTVRGPVDEETGMVLNMVELDSLVQRQILARFDLDNLNSDPHFTVAVPSTENLCRVAWQLLAEGSFGTARLVRIRVEETANNSFEYAGEDSADTGPAGAKTAAGKPARRKEA